MTILTSNSNRQERQKNERKEITQDKHDCRSPMPYLINRAIPRHHRRHQEPLLQRPSLPPTSPLLPRIQLQSNTFITDTHQQIPTRLVQNLHPPFFLPHPFARYDSTPAPILPKPFFQGSRKRQTKNRGEESRETGSGTMGD